MNDEQLIDFVRKYSVLFDLSHSKYMDSVFKNGIWKKIGEEMKTNSRACKARWNNIRDNYRKSLKRNETKSGQCAKRVKLYKYAEQLSFLNTYLRENKGNIDSENGKEDAQGIETEDIDEENTPDYIEDVERTFTTNVESFSFPSPSQRNSVEVHKTFTRPRRLAPNTSSQQTAGATSSQQVNPSPKPTAAATLMSYLISQKQNEASSPSQQEQHPVDAFLGGVAPALKSLSPYQWHLAKSELFNTVQKFEMEMLMDQQSHERASQISGSLTPASTDQSAETFREPAVQDLSQNPPLSSCTDFSFQNYSHKFERE